MQSFKYFLPAILWWVLSLYLFTLPGTAFPGNSWMDKLPVDKLIHVVLFAVLVGLFYRPWLLRSSKSATSAAWLYAIPLLAIAYGVSIEFIQLYFIPNRGFEINDMLADAVGCVAGFAWGRRRWRLQQA